MLIFHFLNDEIHNYNKQNKIVDFTTQKGEQLCKIWSPDFATFYVPKGIESQKWVLVDEMKSFIKQSALSFPKILHIHCQNRDFSLFFPLFF